MQREIEVSMNIDWSNIGAHSRAYGFAIDHNLEYMFDRDFLKFLIGSWMILHGELSELIQNIDKTRGRKK